MKIQNCLKFLVALAAIITACSPDDPEVNLVPERDRAEQQAVDDALLQTYFSTHYYNKDFVDSTPNLRVGEIAINELEEGDVLPDGHALLQGNVMPYTTRLLDVDYTFYILKINQGGGEGAPNFTDKVRVTYEGFLADDGTVFDETVTPVDFDLVGVSASFGVISGWNRVFPEFNEASSFTTGPDGVNYDNYGTGVMFLPSGLGYYANAQQDIPVYSNLVFKFTLFQTEENDHDNDGIPSYLEDLDGDFNTFNEDTDEDFSANFVDADDDGDGVLTRNETKLRTYVVDTNIGDEEPTLEANEMEIGRSESMGIITIETLQFFDTNNNMVFDHLDDEVTTDYSGED